MRGSIQAISPFALKPQISRSMPTTKEVLQYGNVGTVSRGRFLVRWFPVDRAKKEKPVSRVKVS